ncbi:X-Pro dipeptidyl-peptidase [Arachidicoccus ginsenosidimutans]|uniref:DUF885 family protein n=1 Tax=Arachidicoccus sp. BS20 TaxID=1850526 RepID=UPI0007F0A837|nr:DUF885 family protein [Arachidicoccus sp. BS20]ANI89092.1 X-Pro dipeptidyl-peptidase [Arachidicoccus sp. BS20]
MKRMFLYALHICLAMLAFNAANAQVSDDYVPCQVMPQIMTEYKADFQALNSYYTPTVGDYFFKYGSENDPGASPEKRERLKQLYNEYLQKLAAVDFGGLTQECKVDYILFKRNMNENLRQLKIQDSTYQKIKSWMPFADSVYALEKQRRRGIQPDAQKVAKDWYDIQQNIIKLEAQAKSTGKFTPNDIYAIQSNLNNIKRAVRSVYEFYNGYDPMFTWWVPITYKALDSTLTAYSNVFGKKLQTMTPPDKSGIIGQPVGRDELIKELHYEMIPYTPEELIDIANKEYGWCEREMKKASREMGFGDDWKAALEKVKNTYVPPGEQPALILKLYNESINFIEGHNLVTIPPLAKETWGMIMMSPQRQLVNPFFTGGREISVSYPTNTMSEEDKLMSMRGNNPHFSRATVHHELLAGHTLEFFMNSRYRTYRDFDTPFWIEGWSLYWELLLYDMNFPQSPEDRVGMLFWHMHRCARIIFSLNYHMGKWTPEQCIDFLVDKVGHERANADGEVRRSFEGHYSPLYQVAYLTGGRQFYALKKELVDTKKMTYKQFHDAIMHLNEMPIEMIRAILTKQPLSKDYQAHWRFYDESGVE